MCGRQSRVIRIRPSTFVSIIVRSSSSSTCSTGSRPSARPALLTRMSTPPSPSTARRTNSSELARSVTSTSWTTLPGPRQPSVWREPTATLAPASSSARAVAAPIPLEAPVTIAVLPSRAATAPDVTLSVMYGHDGHDHAHGITADTDRRRLSIALGLIVAFMAAEVVVAILANSLALLSDAAHMLTDAGALGLSLVALRLAARPAAGAMTFGLKRAEILSAQANGALLVVLAAIILFEAVRRLIDPPEVGGWAVVATALAGIVVNLLATWQLAQANRENMAVEGSFQHIVTDLYAFVGTLIAGLVINATGYTRADAIASLAVAALMLYAAFGLLRDSGRVLLEGAPDGLRVDEIGGAIAEFPHVANVHDLHVWQIGTGFPALSAHVLVHSGDDCHAIRRELETMLAQRFGIDHTTLQVDHAVADQPLQIRRATDVDRSL